MWLVTFRDIYISDMLVISVQTKPHSTLTRLCSSIYRRGNSISILVVLGHLKCNAPKLWNTLPLSLRRTESLGSFKCDLATYLFKFLKLHILTIIQLSLGCDIIVAIITQSHFIVTLIT